MDDKVITLKALVESLSEAAVYADNRLRLKSSDRTLCVKSMRVSFSANVTEEKNGGELFLDFGNSNSNFNGEIIFNSYVSDKTNTETEKNIQEENL
jgi:hypothetical protein